MESESVVSLRERRGGTDKPAFVKRATPSSFNGIRMADMTLADGSVIQSMRDLNAAQRAAQNAQRAAQAAAKQTSTRAKRVAKEMKKLVAGKDVSAGIHVFPDANQPTSCWRVLMEGPAGSPFEGGVFVLRVDIPSNYPFKAPSIRFETPIYHSNVSGAGKICLEILYSSWSPSLTLPKCIEAIQILLKNPDTDNALRSWIAEETIASKNSGGTETQYVDAAKKLTKEKASDSVDDWKKKWGIVQST